MKYTNLRGGTHPPTPLRLDGPKLAFDVRLHHHFQRWRPVTSHYTFVVQYPPLPNSTGHVASINARPYFSTFSFFPHFLLHGSAKGLNYVSNQPDHILTSTNFCTLISGPLGSCPLFSHSPSPTTYSYISPTFRPFPHFLLQGIDTRVDY